MKLFGGFQDGLSTHPTVFWDCVAYDIAGCVEMVRIKKIFSASESLDLILKDILEQIKIISQEQKDAPYTKLIELFFKGIDLKEKMKTVSKSEEAETPEIKVVNGVDFESI